MTTVLDREPVPTTATATTRWRVGGLVVAVLVVAVMVVVSVLVGTKAIPLHVVWEALFEQSTDPDRFTVQDLRVPRTVVGLVVGIALGVSGALVQALTRNPLADPGILGINAGAAFAVAIGVSVFGVTRVQGYLWLAFAGALVVMAAVLMIGATRQARSPVVLVLAGVSIGAVLNGMVRGLTLLDPQAFDQLRSWEAGSIAGRPLSVVWPVLPFVAGALVLALAMGRSLNAIALGDERAATQGVRVTRTRVLAVAAITVLAGGATAIAGPIAFVGLMIPHVARWITGPDHRWIVAYSALLAPSLLLVSDVLGRVVMMPSEIPVGVVTAFVGAPVLIVLVRRRRASGL